MAKRLFFEVVWCDCLANYFAVHVFHHYKSCTDVIMGKKWVLGHCEHRAILVSVGDCITMSDVFARFLTLVDTGLCNWGSCGIQGHALDEQACFVSKLEF